MAKSDDRDAQDEEAARRETGPPVTRRGAVQSPSEALQPRPAPPRPVRQTRKRRGSILSTVSGILTFLLVASIAALMAIAYGNGQFTASGPLADDKVVFIARGSGTTDIVDQLEREGVIGNTLIFDAGLMAYGKRHEIKAGEYLFKAHASPFEVMTTLVEGKPMQHTVTLPEGLTSEQIVQRLKELKDDDGNYLLAGDVHIPQEGTLMPDTYEFARGDTRESIIKRMQDRQKKVLNDVWAHRVPDTPIKSTFELVTLASIVEKETGKADERPRVAGVFINRMMRHMKLQSDPTIIYGIVGGKGTLGRPILESEVKAATPYNTYVIEGLPPGPICNPGRAAMEGVAGPTRSKELYFVADGTGGHAFAETIEEHLKNVAHWRQIEKEAKDKAPPESDKPTTLPTPKPQQKTEGESDRSATLWSANAASEPAQAQMPLAAIAGAGTEPTSDDTLAISGFKVNFGPSIDAVGWRIAGVDLADDAPDVPFRGDDQADFAAADGIATYPVSPARLADLRARAARWGFNPGSSTELRPGLIEQTAPAAAAANVTPVACSTRAAGLGGRPKAFDASEGTRLDPLRNKSFDLNYAKMVPVAPIVLASISDRNGLGLASAPRSDLRMEAGCRREQVAEVDASASLSASARLAWDLRGDESLADAGAGVSRRPDVFDASEGTRLDPLRNTSYDLNSAHVVPSKAIVFDGQESASSPSAPPATSTHLAPAPAPVPPGVAAAADTTSKTRAFDASEGTSLDPLLNTTFDLNSPQTVPAKSIALFGPEASGRAPQPGSTARAPITGSPVAAGIPLPVRRPPEDPVLSWSASRPIVATAAEKTPSDRSKTSARVELASQVPVLAVPKAHVEDTAPPNSAAAPKADVSVAAAPPPLRGVTPVSAGVPTAMAKMDPMASAPAAAIQAARVPVQPHSAAAAGPNPKPTQPAIAPQPNSIGAAREATSAVSPERAAGLPPRPPLIREASRNDPAASGPSPAPSKAPRAAAVGIRLSESDPAVGTATPSPLMSSASADGAVFRSAVVHRPWSATPAATEVAKRAQVAKLIAEPAVPPPGRTTAFETKPVPIAGAALAAIRPAPRPHASVRAAAAAGDPTARWGMRRSLDVDKNFDLNSAKVIPAL